jgi:hypothetical protein
MILFKETTDWNTPNHVYLLDNSKRYMHGYSILGVEPLHMFKKPIQFDTRGRKFEYVAEYDENNPYTDESVSVEVVGSRGDKYYVKLEDTAAECSCTGFKYRGDCRHIPLARNQLVYL